MGTRVIEGVLLSLVLALPLTLVGPGTQLQGLPEGEVKITTDKLCYGLGESVHITATGWARLPAIGDFPDIFWAVTLWTMTPVFETFNPADVIFDFNGTLTATWNQTYRLANNTPPSGEPVPPDEYKIWFYEIPIYANWHFWPPATIIVGDCDSNLRILTDKDCYNPGEEIVIDLFNAGPEVLTWPSQPPEVFVLDSSDAIVKMPLGWLIPHIIAVPPNQTFPNPPEWNQTYYLYDLDGNMIPPSYQQVPEGKYTIFSWADWPQGTGGTKSVRIRSDCSLPGPTAEAGPDQTVSEGEAVNFDGTGSQGGEQVGQWTPRVNMTPPGCCGAAAVLNDELYYAGGPFSDVVDWNKAWMFRKYTPANDSWTDLPPMPGNKEGPGAASVNGKLYAIGGWSGWYTENTTFEFDPVTNAWTERAPMPIAMAGFAAAVVNNRIYTIGGYSSFLRCPVCGVVFEYDPANDTWSTEQDMPTPRAALAAAVLDGRIYAIGGGGYVALDTVEVFDPASNLWEAKANLSAPRVALAAASLAGDIYAIGGGPDWNILNGTKTIETYDSSSDTWRPGPSMLEERASFGSGVIGNCIYVVGGIGGPMPFLPNVSEALCLETALTYEWDFDASIDSDGDGNSTNDADATRPEPSWTYGDNGDFVVTLEVKDEQGRTDTDTTIVTVLNLPPQVAGDCSEAGGGDADVYLRIAGEKWHDVHATLYAGSAEIGNASIIRMPGSPNDQMARVGNIAGGGGSYSIKVRYTPDDDPINGQPNGATPAWIILRPDNASDIRLHHTFNVRHPETWNWTVTDLEDYLGAPRVNCTATATDPGSDDLTFTWDWGDGTPVTAKTYYNDGVRPDPYPSSGGAFPFTATDSARHIFSAAGNYEVRLTVSDDDGGQVEFVVMVTA